MIRKGQVYLLRILLLEYFLGGSEVKHKFGGLLLRFWFKISVAQFAHIQQEGSTCSAAAELNAYKVAVIVLHGYTWVLLRYTLVSEFLRDHQAMLFALQHAYTYPPKAQVQDVGPVARRFH